MHSTVPLVPLRMQTQGSQRLAHLGIAFGEASRHRMILLVDLLHLTLPSGIATDLVLDRLLHLPPLNVRHLLQKHAVFEFDQRVGFLSGQLVRVFLVLSKSIHVVAHRVVVGGLAAHDPINSLAEAFVGSVLFLAFEGCLVDGLNGIEGCHTG